MMSFPDRRKTAERRVTPERRIVPDRRVSPDNKVLALLNQIMLERCITPKDVIQNAVPSMMVYRRTFSILERVLEARDAYTEHHSERVAAMTAEMCRILMLPMAMSQTIEMTAAIHDIGKAGITDEVLRKPAPLDDEEWAQIKNHPVIGEYIIMAADELEAVATGVRHHHERWDGKGYPDGLSGTEIPLSSRIIAICDSTDAMKSDRPYRKALSDEICKTELQKNSGKMYQPELVELFLKNWDTIAAPLFRDDCE